jgi:hypothetical protein
MLTQVFLTTSVYALAHQIGMLEAIKQVNEQIRQPTRDSLPAVRTIARFHKLTTDASPEGGIGYLVDGGATYIGMARSRMFHEAYQSWMAWITVDDDIEATMPLCQAMLEALNDLVPRVVIVPYMMRVPAGQVQIADGLPSTTTRLAVTLPAIFEERQVRFNDLGGGISRLARLVKMPKGYGGGFGLVGMNRAAMKAIVDAADPAKLRWVDGDGVEKLALFYESLEDGLWYGEDTSFFRHRIPESVSVEALLCGSIVHAGVSLDLDRLGEVPGL